MATEVSTPQIWDDIERGQIAAIEFLRLVVQGQANADTHQQLEAARLLLSANRTEVLPAVTASPEKAARGLAWFANLPRSERARLVRRFR